MQFTPEAQTAWDRYPTSTQAEIMESGFCTRCLAKRRFHLDQGELRSGELVLVGRCSQCGARVVRVVEPEAR